MRRLAWIAAVALGALALAAPATADNAGLTPVEPKSPNAEAITDTYYLLLIVTGVVFIAVEGALVVFLVRYRRRRRPVDAEGPQIHGNTRLEVLWTVVPVFLVAVIVGFVFYKLPDVSAFDDEAIAAPGEADLRVEVLGKQFYWEFRYPDGRITYDALVVPVNRTVELDVTAPDYDVIHSWWIPALGGKIDAIPGIVNDTWFRAENEGVYRGTCGEFCGLQHNAMRASVRAVAAASFEDEVARFADGREQFIAACSKCHNVDGPQLIGPSLRGNPLLADRAGLAQLLRNGRNQMPPVGRDWTDEQIASLVEYTRRIGGEGGG